MYELALTSFTACICNSAVNNNDQLRRMILKFKDTATLCLTTLKVFYL